MTISAPSRETLRTLSLSSLGNELKMVGRAKDMQEKRSIAMLMSAPFTGNFCSFSMPMKCSLYVESLNEWKRPRWFLLGEKPPRKKAVPSTSSTFDSTEPSSDVFTTVKSPFRRDCTATIISTALPKVALRRPVMASFLTEAPNSSVASPRILARGTRARKFSQKVHASPQSQYLDIMPRGTHTRGMQKGWRKIVLRPRRLLGPSTMETTLRWDRSLAGEGRSGSSPGTADEAEDRSCGSSDLESRWGLVCCGAAEKL
mmetsp:Transcript_118057/g.345753  ORF Transcript_118057/g.345753 Transcript_118057/m.345753 type:complete len:258 (+) Transcript_118057:674-1447(+)